MTARYPLKLSYVLKERIWAGTTLSSEEWNKTGNLANAGESWELSVRTKEMCCVSNGPLAGTPLGELLSADPSVLGCTVDVREFPLLVKLIDAGDSLSVQVHPDDAYAARVENDRGKTEMWYIVDARPGAELIMGLVPGTDMKTFRAAVRAGKFEHLLYRRPVQKGECYFIPAGLAHAIGAGILIAEIQQNSDLTYRVYDFDRRDAAGNLRELHVDKALDVIRPFSHEEIRSLQFSQSGGIPPSPECLADCERFTVFERRIQREYVFPTCANARHLLCLKGRAILLSDGCSYPMVQGDSYLLPQGLDSPRIVGDCLVLETVLTDAMLADATKHG